MAKKSKKSIKTSKKLSIKPLLDRVLVKPLSDDPGVTSSGIILPETTDKERPEQGEVVAVGEGRQEGGKLIKPSVKVGDKVVFSKYGYDEVKIDGEEYFILKEDSILAIIK